MSTVFLNGQWCPIEKATISVLDRGFIFGDGVYEVIPVYDRRPYRMQPHLARLQHSMDGIRLSNPYLPEQWRAYIAQLIEQQSFENQAVYIQVTRGVAPRNHAFPESVTPTVFMMSNPLKQPSREQFEKGVSAVSIEDQRWLHCDYKTTSLLGNVLAYQQAVDHQAAEVIQFRNGLLTEAAASNVLIAREGCLMIPKKDHRILHGITMGGVEEVAQRIGIAMKYEDIEENAVRSADEIWISSSTKEMLAVVSLDGKPVGEGMPGPIYKRVYAALLEDIHGV